MRDTVSEPEPSLDDLNSSQPERRLKVLGFFALCGLPNLAVLPRVAALLNDPHAAVRHLAASVLAEQGPKARSCVPALLGVVKHADDLLRRRVCWALGEIGPDEMKS
ncbi:MAG: HEAT repeat domain-containing protein, partial [Gemmataceae bacterium]